MNAFPLRPLKRKTPPHDEEPDDLPALTPSGSSISASVPSSNASSSRPASITGDPDTPATTTVTAAAAVTSALLATGAGAVSAKKQRRSSGPMPIRIAPAPAPVPAPASAPAPATSARPQSAPTPTPTPIPAADASPESTSIVIPEQLLAKFQHAAFPHAFSLVAAPVGSGGSLRGIQPTSTPERTRKADPISSPNAALGSRKGSIGGPSASPTVPAVAGPSRRASTGTVSLGQLLRAPSLSGPEGLSATGNRSPLNRTAVLTAAERAGIKAVNGLPSVNALWHISSYTFCGAIPIHAIMDGYSQRLLALRAGESHHPKVVARVFRDTVKAVGCHPARVRAPEGEAVAWVKDRMTGLRGAARKGKWNGSIAWDRAAGTGTAAAAAAVAASPDHPVGSELWFKERTRLQGRRMGWFIHGPPESNEHLTPIWDMLAASPAVASIANVLQKHTADGVFDKSDPVDRLALQVSYLPHLNSALDQVRKEWNKSVVDERGTSRDALWAQNIQEWGKRGRYPAVEPEAINLPREALAQHSAEEFVNYGATGGPYVPCSISGLFDAQTDGSKPVSNADDSPRLPVPVPSAPSSTNGATAGELLTPGAPQSFFPPSPLPVPSSAAFTQAPLDDIADIDPCLRLWLEDLRLPKAAGYPAVRVAMGEFVSEQFGHVAARFKVARDRAGH